VRPITYDLYYYYYILYYYIIIYYIIILLYIYYIHIYGLLRVNPAQYIHLLLEAGCATGLHLLSTQPACARSPGWPTNLTGVLVNLRSAG